MGVLRDFFSSLLGAANQRLVAINRADPVAMRAEAIHYEAFREHAARLSDPESSSTLRLANDLAIGHRALGRVDDAARLEEEVGGG